MLYFVIGITLFEFTITRLIRLNDLFTDGFNVGD